MKRAAVILGAMVLIWIPAITAAGSSPYKIVFRTIDYDPAYSEQIATVAGDGTALTALTTSDGSYVADPAWSPDGTKIAFSTDRHQRSIGSAGGADIWVMNADGTNPTRVTTSDWDSDTSPGWSPDGTKISFSRNLDLWVVGNDGSNPVRLTFDGSTTWEDDATWSPDGTRIAFDAGLDIDLINPDGTNRTTLLSSALGVSDPDWSPDGSLIALIENTPTGRHVSTVKPDGSGLHRLTNADMWRDNPAWCPDGKAITFVSQETGDMHIYLMNADGSGLTQVTTTGTTNTRPDCHGYAGPTDTAPVAVDDAESVDNGGSVVIDPIRNDYDPDGDPIVSGTVTSGPFHGALTVNPGGTLTYTHDGTATTSDWFDYHVTDGTLDSNTARVHITITAVLGPPAGPVRVGLVDSSTGMWRLLDFNWQEFSFYFGNPGDVPFVGDWNCDGIDTPGLFRQSDAYAYLRNTNSDGVADIRFFFGNPSDIPLAGDFNGDGCDTLSIYRPSEQIFYIINKLGQNEGGLGAAEYSFMFGNPGDKPVVGDWDGDGIDEVGLHRESTGFFYYRNTHTTGPADAQFFFGDPGDRFVGDDFGMYDGVATPAVYRPSGTTFYFRYTLTAGNADGMLLWGETPWLPVAGIFE